MTTVHHINCGSIQVGPDATASCHCLLLDDPSGLALVDAGIGLLDVRDPDGRIGRPLIEAVGRASASSRTDGGRRGREEAPRALNCDTKPTGVGRMGTVAKGRTGSSGR